MSAENDEKPQRVTRSIVVILKELQDLEIFISGHNFNKLTCANGTVLMVDSKYKQKELFENLINDLIIARQK